MAVAPSILFMIQDPMIQMNMAPITFGPKFIMNSIPLSNHFSASMYFIFLGINVFSGAKIKESVANK